MALESRTAASRSMLSVDVPLKAGSPAAWVAALAVVTTPRPCPHSPWAAASVVMASEVVSVAVGVGSGVGSVAVETAAVSAVVVAVACPTVVSEVALEDLAVATEEETAEETETDLVARRLTRLADPDPTAVGTADATAAIQGLVETAEALTLEVVDALMTTDPAAAEVASATTADELAATWSRSAPERMVGIATATVIGIGTVTVTVTETTTDLGTTTENAATRVPTTTRARFVATNRSRTCSITLSCSGHGGCHQSLIAQFACPRPINLDCFSLPTALLSRVRVKTAAYPG